MSEAGEPYPPRHGDLFGRTQSIRTPEDWHPRDWGGWEILVGVYTEEGNEWNVLHRPPDESWQVACELERGKPFLLNPLIVEGPETGPREYWPDCLEDLQSLLSQVACYGYARELDDGWDLRATVTAAEARAAIAADGALRPIYYDDKVWRFTDTAGAVPLPRVANGRIPPRMTPASFANDLPSAVQRPARERQQPARSASLREPSSRTAPPTSATRQRPGTASARHSAATGLPGERRTR